MAMSFSSWEQEITNSPGYPNNNEVRLAIQTLKVCITESPIANDEIGKNGYALFDYVMFCYFVFRAGLCEAFSRNFVESYDTYIQNLMSWYFNDFFKIPRETIRTLIVSRANEYESLIDQENIVYQATTTLTQYIEKDLAGIPLRSELLLTDIFDNFELHMKLSEYIQATLPALEKQRAFILLCESKKSLAHSTPPPALTNQNKAQPVTEKKEEHTQQEEQIKSAAPPQTKINNTKRSLRNDVMLITAIIGIIATMFFVIFFDTENYKILLLPVIFYILEFFIIGYGLKKGWIATLCFSPFIFELFTFLIIDYLFSWEIAIDFIEWFSMIGVTISVLIFEYKFATHNKK